MSSTFDTLQQGLEVLRRELPEDNQQLQDIICYMRRTIDDLHDISHSHDDWLNRGPDLYEHVNALRLCLRYPDNQNRAFWLKAAQGD